MALKVTLMIAYMNFPTCCVLRARLELRCEYLFDSVGGVCIRFVLVFEILRLDASLMGQDSLLALLSQLFSIVIMEAEFRCSHRTPRREEFRTHSGFNIESELFIILAIFSALRQPINHVMSIVVISL